MTKDAPVDEHSNEIDLGRTDKRFVDHQDYATYTALITIEVRDRAASVSGQSVDARTAEFKSLANAINLDIGFENHIIVRQVKPATFIGGGQLESLVESCKELDEKIELYLFDCALSPVQQRNLERELGAKVLDRTALILEIFGARAATREGVLQVELAHLKYQKSRLVRSWTHLERQRGGFGFVGGPGETQIEADRRMLRDRISALEKRIEQVRQNRQLQRKPRDAVPFPLVALVGYTNAGKSTLFNRLTGSDVMAKDMLFATLDTTVRKVKLPHGREIMLSDTVGFIADLPTDLVAAFRATLEEVTTADLILHVRDLSNEDHETQAKNVVDVLSSIGVEPGRITTVEVWNKIDTKNGLAALDHTQPMAGVEDTVGTSAVTGEGVGELLHQVEEQLSKNAREFSVNLPLTDGQGLAWLYDHAEVLDRVESESGIEVKVRVQPRFFSAFQEKFVARRSSVAS